MKPGRYWEVLSGAVLNSPVTRAGPATEDTANTNRERPSDRVKSAPICNRCQFSFAQLEPTCCMTTDRLVI